MQATAGRQLNEISAALLLSGRRISPLGVAQGVPGRGQDFALALAFGCPPLSGEPLVPGLSGSSTGDESATTVHMLPVPGTASHSPPGIEHCASVIFLDISSRSRDAHGMTEREQQLMVTSLARLRDALTLLHQVRLPLSANLEWRKASLDTAKKLLEELASGLEKDRETAAAK